MQRVHCSSAMGFKLHMYAGPGGKGGGVQGLGDGDAMQLGSGYPWGPEQGGGRGPVELIPRPACCYVCQELPALAVQ